MINRYDALIKTAVENHMVGCDWRLLKAQLQAESSLNPNAISSVGAMGIAQFMPKTWQQIKDEMKLSEMATPENPQVAIPAAAFYMSKLYKKWSAPRPASDKYCLALASYNAGFGNMLKAQKKAGGANDYYTISAHLYLVTGDVNAIQTLTYVNRIFRLWGEYIINGR